MAVLALGPERIGSWANGTKTIQQFRGKNPPTDILITLQKKKFDYQLLARIISLAKPHKTVFITAISLSIFIALISPLRPYLVNLMVNDFIYSTIIKVDGNDEVNDIEEFQELIRSSGAVK